MNIKSRGYRIFLVFDYLFIGLLALLCLFPMLNVLAISFSSSTAAADGSVVFWPEDFFFFFYEYVTEDVTFLSAMAISCVRVILGTGLQLLFTVLCAYPLSKDSRRFKARTVYAWYFVFTTLFGGGMIPTYVVVNNTNLINTIWALILPGVVPVFNIILMINFFRGIPNALEEAALIDGAGHFRVLRSIYIPLAAPSIATVTLFSLVAHWNSWFDGMLYINDVSRQPVATYLQSKLINSSLNTAQNITDLNTLARLTKISDQTVKSALVFVGIAPILLVYPFLQKYFTQGLTVGSVKE